VFGPRTARWRHWWSKPEVLPLPHGDVHSSGSGINDRGVIVGESGPGTDQFDPSMPIHPVLRDRHGHVHRLPTRPAAGLLTEGHATAVNKKDQVVGELITTDHSGSHAVRWDRRGHLTDIGTLSGENQATALAIANNGWVVGLSGARAFFWPGHGPMLELPTLNVDGTSPFSEALHVDSAGTASGLSAAGATVWTCIQQRSQIGDRCREVRRCRSQLVTRAPEAAVAARHFHPAQLRRDSLPTSGIEKTTSKTSSWARPHLPNPYLQLTAHGQA
jgi:hypothetical protein